MVSLSSVRALLVVGGTALLAAYSCGGSEPVADHRPPAVALPAAHA